jgi:hypothetical protein
MHGIRHGTRLGGSARFVPPGCDLLWLPREILPRVHGAARWADLWSGLSGCSQQVRFSFVPTVVGREQSSLLNDTQPLRHTYAALQETGNVADSPHRPLAELPQEF